jgi:alpha-galactosidase
MPWYNVEWPSGGLLAAIGWSGQWKATIARSGVIDLKAGMEDGHFYLAPGEKIRTPRIVLTQWRGSDLARSYNLWRQIMFDHYMPRVDGKLVFPPIAKTTAYDELDVSVWRSTHGEANQMDIIRQAAELGMEYYWLDAYWFHGYFPKGVGNWQFPIENAVRDSFPHGLRPLADLSHKLGLKFILWFEPERVAPGTYLDREKGDWLIRPPDAKTYLFRLGDSHASEWITRYIIDTLKAFDVDVFRIDFNVDPLPYWRFADKADRRGITEIRHIENLYKMWDQIRAGKPGIWIDNCASGGRRNDIETCSRALPLWRSDFNDNPKHKTDEIGAIADQVMTMGLSLYMPLHAGPAWRPEPYYWRSAMSAGNNIYWDVRPNRKTGAYDYDRELTKKAIAECKSLRPYYLGDYYPLTEMNADPAAWAAYEYVRQKEGDGFAVFFRRPKTGSTALDVQLRGLDPQKTYQVTWYWKYEPGRTATMKGSELARFHAEVPEQPGSLLIRFQRQ